MTRRRIAAVLAVGFALGGLAVEAIATSGDIRVGAVIDLVAGWVVAAAGVVGWLVVPRSRVGPLLMGVAVAWFLGTLLAPGSPIARADLGRTAGFLVQLHAGLLVHAVATWPTGRIVRPTQLATVAGGYIAALFPQIWYESPGYLVLGGLLATATALDHRALTPGRRAAYRPARSAGLLLAAGLAFVPWIAGAFADLGWVVVAGGERLWAALVAVIAAMLSAALVARSRPGAVADIAVRLRTADGLGSGDAVARSLREATAAEPHDDPALQVVLARVTAMAERNRSLRVSLSAQVEELEASRRRLIEVSDEERQALVERLRAGADARLQALESSIAAISVTDRTTAPSPGGLTGRLERASMLLRHARSDLDRLAGGLDPGGVAERGLKEALHDLVASSPVPVELTVTDPGPVGVSTRTTLYYVASEALANVVRHARAQRAWLQLQRHPAGWRLLVEDDGVGGADPTAGTGLRGLQERLQALGGSLQVGPRSEGGTRLVANVPPASSGDAR